MVLRRPLVASVAGGVAIAAAAAVFACSSFEGDVTSDAMVDGAPTDDAGTDATTDAPQDRDAVSDAAFPGVGCDAAHLFCDDFDDQAPFPPGRWSTFMLSGGSADRVDGGVDGSLAGGFTVAASDSGVFDGPRVAFVVPGPLTGLRCEFDVSSGAAQAAPAGQATFFFFLRANLPPSSPTTFWLGGLRFDGPTSFLLTEEYEIDDAGADGGENHFGGGVPLPMTNYRQDGTWTHVSISVDGMTQMQSVTVGAFTKSGPVHFPSNAESVVLELGNEAFNPTQPFAVRFDNFVCDRP